MLEHLLHIFILGMNGDNTDSQKLNKIISEIQALQEVVARFRQLRLDATEFACLKCIVTFKAGKQIQTAVSSSSFAISVIQFSSVTQLCPTLCDPMDCSTPGLPVHHNSQSLYKLMSIELLFDDPVNVGKLITCSSAFSKTSLKNIWKFMFHKLLKPDLENFEHYFTSM